MKRNSLVIFILFLSILISCSAEKYKVTLDGKEFVLEEGMSMEEVKDILGSNYKEQQNKALGFENWVYSSGVGKYEKVKVTFNNKKLVGAHDTLEFIYFQF